MLQIGRWSILLGAACVVLGLLVGFGAMVAGHQGRLLMFIGLMPFGVLLAFGGVCVVALTEPRQDSASLYSPDDDD